VYLFHSFLAIPSTLNFDSIWVHGEFLFKFNCKSIFLVGFDLLYVVMWIKIAQGLKGSTRRKPSLYWHKLMQFPTWYNTFDTNFLNTSTSIFVVEFFLKIFFLWIWKFFYCFCLIVYCEEYAIYNILNSNTMFSIVFKYNSNVLFKNNE
jgi:hypothetical protein